MLTKQKGNMGVPRNILNNALLALHFINAKEQKKQLLKDIGLTGEVTAGLNQSMCFKDVLTSEWKSGKMFHWGRGYAFFQQEMKSCGFLQN